MDITEIENRRIALQSALAHERDMGLGASETVETAERFLAFLSGPKTQEA